MPADLVLGVDGSWECIGWTIWCAGVPFAWGTEQLPKAWRRHHLRTFLDRLEGLLVEAQLEHDTLPPRLVVERAPVRNDLANQAATGFGMGDLYGAIMSWGCRPDWLYPWGIRPGSNKEHGWRHWHGYGRRSAARAKLKAHAVLLVSDRATRHVLAGLDLADVLGPPGDLAESLLIARGAAAHNRHGPAGPRGWTQHPDRVPGEAPPWADTTPKTRKIDTGARKRAGPGRRKRPNPWK